MATNSIFLPLVKCVRNISTYLLVLFFLVPATGFYYTKHSCFRSGEVRFILDGEYSCCAGPAEITRQDPEKEGNCCTQFCHIDSSGQTEENKNCSLDNTQTDCCKNEGNYLKSEDEFTSPGKVDLPHFGLLVTAALFSVEMLPVLYDAIEENAHSPPCLVASPDILLRHSVLLI